MENANLGVCIDDYLSLGKKLRISSEDSIHIMSDHESTLMEQLDAYDDFFYDE